MQWITIELFGYKLDKIVFKNHQYQIGEKKLLFSYNGINITYFRYNGSKST